MNICFLMLHSHPRMIKCRARRKKKEKKITFFFGKRMMWILAYWERKGGMGDGEWRTKPRSASDRDGEIGIGRRVVGRLFSLLHMHMHMHASCHACPALWPWNEVSHLVAWGKISSLLVSSPEINWQKQIPEYAVYSVKSAGYTCCYCLIQWEWVFILFIFFQSRINVVSKEINDKYNLAGSNLNCSDGAQWHKHVV